MSDVIDYCIVCAFYDGEWWIFVLAIFLAAVIGKSGKFKKQAD